MDVSYQAFRKGKLIDDKKSGYMCFSSLRDLFRDGNPEPITAEYSYTTDFFSPEQMTIFNDEANRWGCLADYAFDGKIHKFVVAQGKTYLSLLSPLVIRRYMEEQPDLIKIWFSLKEAYPDIESFYLFQLCHYFAEDYYYNANHTFLSGDIYNGYNGKTKNLVDVAMFARRVAEYVLPLYVGLNKLITHEVKPASDIDIKDLLPFYTNKKVDKLVKLLTV